MSDRKALTSDIGGGARFQIGDDDDRTVPAIKSSSGSKPAFFSQWMNRLGGATKRRGSVGFNENNLADLPPSRFDDDSRSNSFIDGPDSRDGFSNSLLPRKRNESFNEYGTTPGDDSDGYLLRNKFRLENHSSAFGFLYNKHIEGETTPTQDLRTGILVRSPGRRRKTLWTRSHPTCADWGWPQPM